MPRLTSNVVESGRFGHRIVAAVPVLRDRLSKRRLHFRRTTISLEIIRVAVNDGNSSGNERAALLTIGDSGQSACSSAREASVTGHWQFIAIPLFFRSLFPSPPPRLHLSSLFPLRQLESYSSGIAKGATRATARPQQRRVIIKQKTMLDADNKEEVRAL